MISAFLMSKGMWYRLYLLKLVKRLGLIILAQHQEQVMRQSYFSPLPIYVVDMEAEAKAPSLMH